MNWIKYIIFNFLFFIISCDIGDVPEPILNNPIDPEFANEQNIETPALIFFQDHDVSIGTSVMMEAYIVDVSELSMVHIQLQYDPQKLFLNSVNYGEFFQNTNSPLIVYDNDESNGLIDIYMSFLDNDFLSVNGTGNIANIYFNTISSGSSKVFFTENSQFLSFDDDLIEIKFLDEAIVNVN